MPPALWPPCCTLGRWCGVDVEVRLSLLLAALAAVLRQGSVVAAAATFLGLFALMFAHALAQALAAERSGFAVERIAPQPLNAFGALGIPATAPESLLVALAGPLACLLGVAALGALSRLLFGEFRDGLAQAARMGLGWSLLQCLPGLPLDGGYALCSALARRRTVEEAVQQTLGISAVVHATIVLFGLISGRFLWLLLAALLYVTMHLSSASLRLRTKSAAKVGTVSPPPYARRARSRRIDVSRLD